MQAEAPLAAFSKDLSSGREQLPAGQPMSASLALRGCAEVGRQERVGQLARGDRLRHHPALAPGVDHGLGDDDLLRDRLEAGGLEHLPLEPPGRVGDLGVLGEQGEQRCVPSRGLGEDRRHPVQPLELLVAVRLAARLVGLDAGALLAHQQGDDLELRAHRRHHRPALDCCLDLAYGAREHRDDALVVEVADPTPVSGRRTASALLARASSSHRLLLRSTPAGRRDGYDDIRHAALRPGDADIGGRPGWPSARRCSAHGSARDRRGGSDGPATLWNPRPPFGGRLTATPPRRLRSPNVSPNAVRRQY